MRRLLGVVGVVAVAGCGLIGKGEAPLDAAAPPRAEGALATKDEAAATTPPTVPAPPTGPAPAAAPPAVPAPPPAGAAPTPSSPPAAVPQAASPPGFDPRAIEEATGLSGATMPDGVFRITKPRGDLKVALDGFPITPRMGLAGWVAFRPHASGAMLVGVMPVAADELGAVVTALVNAGLEPTAIHSHFVGEVPPTAFVHFAGIGNGVALARGVRDVLDAIVRARAARPQNATGAAVHTDLDVAALDAALGARGEFDGQVYRIAVARPDLRVRELDVELGPTMSPTSWAAFQGDAERAAVAGEILVTPAEAEGVIHALRQARIGVVGLHDESIRDTPPLALVSFWGVGRLEALAAGVRRALDQLPRG